MNSADSKLQDDILQFYADPLGYVMYVFPWDSDPSIQLVKLLPEYQERFNCEYGPDLWACRFLDELGEDIKKRGFDGRTAVEPIRYATASGHGIGKSALTSWLIKFIMDTRPESVGVVTANTGEQLRTKTWAELGKWNSLSITGHWYSYSSGRGSMSFVRKGYTKKWRCDAMTCREENSEAFQGLHAANATPFYIFDEASGIPDKIFQAREGGATDGEPMWFDFGNPTRNTGYFFENCVGKFKHRYRVRHIDSRDVQITNKRLFQEWLEDRGEDSDFFKVKVRGIFPSAGSIQFINSDSVREAVARDAVLDPNAPLIIGVDVARFGDDDSVIYPRIGYDAKSFPYRRYSQLDNIELASKVIDMVHEFAALGKPVAGIFVDGTGLGSGVVDYLRHLGYNPIDVQFGQKARDAAYRYRSDELWGRMRDALPRLALPDDPDLYDQLTQREYGHTLSGQIHLEPKKDMKNRLGTIGSRSASPDIADALAITFAEDVAGMMPVRPEHWQATATVKFDYDPLEEKW